MEILLDELRRILRTRAVSTVFQPIVNIKRKEVFAYEALTRGPSDSPLHAPDALFEVAGKHQLTALLETLCLQTALQSWKGHALDTKLFVNVSPVLLIEDHAQVEQLIKQMEGQGIAPSQLVMEISENYPTLHLQPLLTAIDWLKTLGVSIAIDDLGTGYSGLKLWSDIKPDYVKIDRHFVHDIHDDLVKLEFVRSLVDLADRLGCSLIAEGVESQAELQVVSELNINLIQGYLTGRPRPLPCVNLDAIHVNRERGKKITGRLARDLSAYIEPVAPTTSLREAWERLQKQTHIFSLPVVSHGRPLGLLHKWRVLELYGTQYGRALYERRPVIQFVGKDSLVVECDSTLDEISQRLVEEDFHYLKQHFIVVNQGLYTGLGTTRTLLKHITHDRLEKARYSNPLTQLPGNIPINAELEMRLGAERPFYFIYFDINDFKPLNDVLGYQVGDAVIVQLAKMLSAEFNQSGDFVGHVGGDDFVVMSEREEVAGICRELQQRFAQVCRQFYPEECVRRGYIESRDRAGFPCRFPLTSVAVALVEIVEPARQCKERVSDTAAMVKKLSKESAQRLWIEQL